MSEPGVRREKEIVTTTSLGNYVSMKELAARAGLDRSRLLKDVKKRKLTLLWARTADSGYQLTYVVSRADAEEYIRLRIADGFPVPRAPTREEHEATAGG